jgi:hypothetical protein
MRALFLPEKHLSTPSCPTILRTPANEIVIPIPKAMKKDNMRPIAKRFWERLNNIMITTPGQGTTPTAMAIGKIPL